MLTARTLLAAALALTACGGQSVTAPVDAAPPVDAALDATAAPPERPTYWAHVAPMLQQRCNECHVAGGLAPFALATYEDARSRGALLLRSVTSRAMPPWPPAQSCRPIAHTRALPAADTTLLERWVAAGMPEGDRASFRARPGAPSMLPERPSITVQPEAPYVPGGSRIDDYHCFVMDPNLTADRDLVGARFVPGEPRTVHHVIVYEVKTAALAELQRLDDAEPGPGYTCFGGPGVRGGMNASQFVAGWAPGSPPVRFPENTGIRLSAGSRLVMQVHYNQANGRGLPDRTRAELFFSEQSVSRVAYVLPLVQSNLRIAAGDRNASATASINLRRLGVPITATLHGVFPHMHTLGTRIAVDVQRAGDASAPECVVDIPRWDFHWQQFYFFEEPLRIGPDDTVRLRCEYDNSAANQPVVDGVPQQPRDVRWGEGTFDEMCLNFFYATVP